MSMKFWRYFSYTFIVFGAVLIAIMLLLPGGVAGGFRRLTGLVRLGLARRRSNRSELA